MSKKRGLAVSIGMITLLMNPVAIATSNGGWKGYKPYVGVDAQMRRMDFKGGFGDNLLRHNAGQGNIYAGLKLNDCLGVEAGFESTETRTRDTRLYAGELAAGTPIGAATSPIDFKSKIKIKGPHVDLVGFYSFGENVPVQLLGSAGVSFFKGTAERRTLQFGTPPQASTMTRTLSTHKAVLRLMGGLQYLYDGNLGFRATIGLVKTGKLIMGSNDGVSSRVKPEIKPKDSTIYGLGMFWVF